LSIESGKTASILPRDIKERALKELSVLSNESKRFRKAAREIEKSLDGRLWTDSSHLDLKHGHKVFDRERSAVKELMHILGKPEEFSVGVIAVANKTMADLVTADSILAHIAIGEAKEVEVVDPKRRKKVDKELAKAQRELGKGDSAKVFGETGEAIKHYKKSWNHSMKAAKEAAKKPGEGNGKKDKDENDDGDDEDSGNKVKNKD